MEPASMAASGGRPKMRTSFKKTRCIAPLHTSGPVAISAEGGKLVTCIEDTAILTALNAGTEICRFAGDTRPITSLCVSPSGRHLALFTSSPSLRVYEIPHEPTGGKLVQPIRVIARAHDTPVHVCTIDRTATYLASGSTDGTVKVWNILRGYVTHVFKAHGGAVSALCFSFPQDPSSVIQEPIMHLITASSDNLVRIFDLNAKSATDPKPQAVLEGHFSVPRGLDISTDGRWLISGGRDSIVLIWDLPQLLRPTKSKSKPAAVKTIPILERVEAVGLLKNEDETGASLDSLRIFTAGEKGVVKVWNGQGKLLYALGEPQGKVSDDQEEQRQIVQAIYVPLISAIVSVHADQNILFHSLTSRALTRQVIGYNDEIVDATFITPHTEELGDPQRDAHLAIATNSSLIRVYDISTLDARLLSGHTDIVLCLDRGPHGLMFASGSKDHSARLWATSSAAGVGELGWGCVGICEGHTESIAAIALARSSPSGAKHGCPTFMFTGSQDRTIKMWDLSMVSSAHGSNETSSPTKCKSLMTQKAHEKDINSLDVAPNDTLLASGSQDRTAKVYEIIYTTDASGKLVRGEFKLKGTFTGHKRGVWTVRFGRAERVLATGSADKTIKLWSLEDFSCVKTLEGHTNSVLRVDFINKGMQMLSSASDGLVKLWNIREEECMATMDNHEDKIWALAISADERTVVSGAADSVITFWEDCTEEEAREKESKKADLALKEQDFHNYVALHNYRKAIQLALAMEQPGRLFNLFKQIRSGLQESPELKTSITGDPAVDEVIRTLTGSELAKLLRYIRDWNTNAKTSEIAQGVLYAILKTKPAEEVMAAFGDEVQEALLITEGGPHDAVNKKESRSGSTALKELVDSFIPYTERHLARMEKLIQDSYVVDYILGEMDNGMIDLTGDVQAMDVDDDLVG